MGGRAESEAEDSTIKLQTYLLYYSAGLTLFRVETKPKLFKKNLSRP